MCIRLCYVIQMQTLISLILAKNQKIMFFDPLGGWVVRNPITIDHINLAQAARGRQL